MEQGENEENGKVAVEIPFPIGGNAGGPFFAAKEWPSSPPKNSPEGESFDSLLACRLGRAVDARHRRAPPLWTPPLNDQRKGPAGPLLLETSPGFSSGRKFTPAAYSVTPPGFDGWGVLTERLRIPRAQGQGQGQGPGQGQGLGETAFGVVRDVMESVAEKRASAPREELPLLTAVRRAEGAVSFVRGQRRNLTVSLPETAGGRESGLSLEALDRSVERDARRYGGSVFY